MEPLSINSSGVLQLSNGQILQSASGGQVFQIQIPQQQLQTLQNQPQQIQIQQLPTLQQHPQQQTIPAASLKPKAKQKAAAKLSSVPQLTAVPQIEFKTIPDALQQFTIQPDGQLVQYIPDPPLPLPPPTPPTDARVIKVPAKKNKGNGKSRQLQIVTDSQPSTADFTVIKVDDLLSLNQLEEGRVVKDLAVASKKKTNVDKNGEKKTKTPHICQLCAKDFKSKGNLKRHLKDFHSADSSERVTYHCDLCKKDFQNRFNLRRHRLGVHGAVTGKTRDYPCEICLKVFNYGDNLKRHRRNVHGIIGEIGETPTTADGHMLAIESSGEIQASEAGTLDIKANVNETEVHNFNKAHICEICDKNLQSGYNLKRHKAAVHKETRILYGCDECEKNFTSITNYRRHKIMIHGPGKEANKCDKVGWTFCFELIKPGSL